MAKIRYDVSDVEPGVDFDTPIPVGIYKCKIAEAKEDESKSSGNPMISLTLQVTSDEKGGKEFKGRNIWDYIVLNDASEWKLRQLTDALGLPAKGSFDPREIIGETVRVRVKHEPSEEFGTRAKVGSLLPVKAGKADSDEDEDEPEDEAANGGDEEVWTLKELKAMDRDELEGVVEDEDLDVEFDEDDKDDELLEAIAEELGIEIEKDEDEDEEPEHTYEEIQKLRMTQLKKLNKEEGLKVRITEKSKLDTIRDKVCEALGLEEEEEEEDEGAGEDYTFADIEEMDFDDLKDVIEEEDLDIRVTKRSKEESIRAKVLEALEIEEEEEEEEEDYDDLDPADLKATCKERGLSAAGTKATLIKRLRKDDEEDGEPF